jgi:hypothetical protein
MRDNSWKAPVCEDILPTASLWEAQGLAFRKAAAPQRKFEDPVWRRLPALTHCT